MAIWNDIAPELREDFFEWHPREHMVERLAIPGFLRGRRYQSVDEAVEFLTLYEVADPEVLVSESYKSRLTNPTEWSTKTLPGFRNNVRGACRIHFTEGVAMGGIMHTIRFRALDGQTRALVEALKHEVMPGFSSLPRITGVHLVENDSLLTAGNAGNQRGRQISLPHLVVLVEGSCVDGVLSACRARLPVDRLRAFGGGDDLHAGTYRLEYSIQNLDGAHSGPREGRRPQ